MSKRVSISEQVEQATGAGFFPLTDGSGDQHYQDFTLNVKSSETLTSLSISGRLLTYVDESGSSTVIQIPETITTLALVEGSLIFTNETGTPVSIDLPEELWSRIDSSSIGTADDVMIGALTVPTETLDVDGTTRVRTLPYDPGAKPAIVDLGNGVLGLAAKVTASADSDTVGGESKAQIRTRSSHTGTQAISTVTGLQTALDGKVPASEKGAANGVATLDGSGLIPTGQLPSFVDDVLEYANLAAFPGTGEAGKIYVALDSNKTYRWSGSAYIYITSGAVDSVSGKTGVVTLVKGDVGLGNVDNTSDASKPVSTAQQTALDGKANTSHTQAISTVTGLQTALDGKYSAANPPPYDSPWVPTPGGIEYDAGNVNVGDFGVDRTFNLYSTNHWFNVNKDGVSSIKFASGGLNPMLKLLEFGHDADPAKSTVDITNVTGKLIVWSDGEIEMGLNSISKRDADVNLLGTVGLSTLEGTGSSYLETTPTGQLQRAAVQPYTSSNPDGTRLSLVTKTNGALTGQYTGDAELLQSCVVYARSDNGATNLPAGADEGFLKTWSASSTVTIQEYTESAGASALCPRGSTWTRHKRSTWDDWERTDIWVFDGTDVTTSLGNVGIGVSDPLSEFHLSTGSGADVGNIAFTIGGVTSNARTGQIIKNTSAPYEMTIKSTNHASIGDLIINPTAGNVGIGTVTPSQKFDVSGNINSTGIIQTQGSWASKPLRIGNQAAGGELWAAFGSGITSFSLWVNDGASVAAHVNHATQAWTLPNLSGTGTRMLTANSTGLLGEGVDVSTIYSASNPQPAPSLQSVVTAGKSITGTGTELSLESNRISFDRNNTSYIDQLDDAGHIEFRMGSTFTSALMIRSDGDIGIGTSSPNERLHIVGGSIRIDNDNYLKVDNAAGGQIRMVGINAGNVAYAGPMDAGPTTMIYAPASSITNSRWLTSGAESMRLTATGLGIGITAPTEKLHVVGNALISGLSGTGTCMVTASPTGLLGSGVDVTTIYSASNPQPTPTLNEVLTAGATSTLGFSSGPQVISNTAETPSLRFQGTALSSWMQYTSYSSAGSLRSSGTPYMGFNVYPSTTTGNGYKFMTDLSAGGALELNGGTGLTYKATTNTPASDAVVTMTERFKVTPAGVVTIPQLSGIGNRLAYLTVTGSLGSGVDITTIYSASNPQPTPTIDQVLTQGATSTQAVSLGSLSVSGLEVDSIADGELLELNSEGQLISSGLTKASIKAQSTVVITQVLSSYVIPADATEYAVRVWVGSTNPSGEDEYEVQDRYVNI